MLQDKTFIVTGANTGIGKVSAAELAKRGANVILACRSRDKTEPVIEELKRDAKGTIEFLQLDLGSLDAVREAAKSLVGRRFYSLINNAGLAGSKGLTKDGFELAFGTNHLAHYLWTRLLLPQVDKGGRIVNVASDSHYQAKAIDWAAVRETSKSTTGMKEYEVSKLANVLFTAELARRAPQLTTYALHPGVVATDVWRKVPAPVRWVMKRFMISPTQGATASLRCATDPALATSTGEYFDPKGHQKQPSKLAQDVELQHELWKKSAEWVGLPVD